jgi:hypothetical protein
VLSVGPDGAHHAALVFAGASGGAGTTGAVAVEDAALTTTAAAAATATAQADSVGGGDTVAVPLSLLRVFRVGGVGLADSSRPGDERNFQRRSTDLRTDGMGAPLSRPMDQCRVPNCRVLCRSCEWQDAVFAALTSMRNNVAQFYCHCWVVVPACGCRLVFDSCQAKRYWYPRFCYCSHPSIAT